jgi:hypothetical protein
VLARRLLEQQILVVAVVVLVELALGTMVACVVVMVGQA